MKKLLPIGSVLLLKGGNKKVMVVGRIQQQSDTDKIWDYSGCIYPEGVLTLDKTYLFDNENIERVYFLGFQDSEEFEFKDFLCQEYPAFMEVEKANQVLWK